MYFLNTRMCHMKIVRNIFLSLTLLVSPAFVLAGYGEGEQKKSSGIFAYLYDGAFGLVAFPVIGAGSVIRFAADKTGFIPVVGKIATFGFLKDGTIGKFLENNKDYIGGALFIAVAVPIVYLTWNKYQEWKRQHDQDEDFDFRAFFNEDEESETEDVVGN